MRWVTLYVTVHSRLDSQHGCACTPDSVRGLATTCTTQYCAVGVVQRFFLPRRIERFYFIFGRAINVPEEVYRDKKRAAAVYAAVKAGVNNCIDHLLEERERDPFRGLLKRAAYERSRGTRAPTFQPDPEKKLL